MSERLDNDVAFGSIRFQPLLPATMSVISQKQKDQFYERGYLVLPHFLSDDETNALLSRSKARGQHRPLDPAC